MALTKTGDLLIRGSAGTGFEVLDAVAVTTWQPSPHSMTALTFAANAGGAVWQQATDNRGRRMGDPTVIRPRHRE